MLAAAGDTQNQQWASNKSRFGFKMLEKMGWSEGKGLGMNEDGETSHIKLKKKSNNLGIGAEVGQNDRWFSVTNNYNDLLAKLGDGSAQKEKKSKKAKKEKKAKKQKKEAAEGADGNAKGKKRKRDEAAEEEGAAGGGDGGDDEAARKLRKAERKARRAKKAAAAKEKVVFRKRARAKNARNYSAEAMKEILGES
eukprot:SAG22_NODE_898_length_6620_cov_13.916884_3_plen_195_part_00